VAIPLEVLSGLGELMDGKIVDGSMSLASALGAGLMMAPGGQHVGAAIILRSAVAKKLWGDDPSARAELAAEAEVKELLEFAGLSADSASVLSDVLEEGQRSMGPFISWRGPLASRCTRTRPCTPSTGWGCSGCAGMARAGPSPRSG
jgi:hypothetical protein